MRDLYDHTNDVLYEKFRLSKLESFGFNAKEGYVCVSVEK